MLRAYLAYYWPISRAQAQHALAVTAALEEMRGRASLPPRRVVDAGSGPGPVAAAFADAGAVSFVLVDQSVRALELARERLSFGRAHPIEIDAVKADLERVCLDDLPRGDGADWLSFGHSLNELYVDREDRIERRAELVVRLAGSLAPGGRVLIIEPALLGTSRDTLALRDLLVSRGWRVVAPCVGRGILPCPALAAGPAHTCHETVPWRAPPETAALAAGLGLDRDWVKMTWFVLEPPVGVDGVAHDLDAVALRVVSDPMLNKAGRVRRLLCGAAGRVPYSVAPDASGTHGAFEGLARGDIVAVEGAQRREGGWGIVEGTRTRVLLAAAEAMSAKGGKT
ncbi:MAG TPA: small ribosomal subunit Rsm22 family protein [Treponemataceae bacterium]|mgnify:CR=1 FL=1|nr:small ribosomal subunit Rsm22 family protein [Treponemataceae bacterium]